MAATELIRSPAGRRCPDRATFASAYGAVWAATLASAGLVALGGTPAAGWVRRTLGLTLTPSEQTPAVAHVLGLAAHNIPLAAWPLLLGPLRARDSHRVRRAADVLVFACLLANCIPVGAAIGAYGTPLLPYIVQLPVEWAGLAVGYGSWLLERRSPLGRGRRLRLGGVIVVTLLTAAALETYATPRVRDAHRGGLERPVVAVDERMSGNLRLQ
jgi:hypothetical protein